MTNVTTAPRAMSVMLWSSERKKVRGDDGCESAEVLLAGVFCRAFRFPRPTVPPFVVVELSQGGLSGGAARLSIPEFRVW